MYVYWWSVYYQYMINNKISRWIYISEQNRDLQLAAGGVSLMSSGVVGGASASWTNAVSLKQQLIRTELTAAESLFLFTCIYK